MVNPSLGLAIVLFSGMLTASFAAPMKLSRRWNWENTWLVYATFALVLIPFALVAWAIPHPFTFFSSIPLAVFHPDDLLGRVGLALLVSAALLVIGLMHYVQAGRQRELNQTVADTTGVKFRTGVLLCIFTGCFGSMINIGFVFGAPIAQRAVQLGVKPGSATLSVWLIVLVAGYFPNLAYTLLLLKRNGTVHLFRNQWARESLLSSAAAVLWLFGMLGYGIGAGVMGKYGNSLGFSVCMGALLLWSSVLGLIAGNGKRFFRLHVSACIRP